VGGTGEGVFALDSNSLTRSETSINLFRAIWEAVSADLVYHPWKKTMVFILFGIYIL